MDSLRSTSTSLSCVLVILTGLVGLVGPGPVRAQQAEIFTVTATSDAGDVEPGDATCATSQGECTLRAAIEESNALFNELGPQVIEFDIPGAPPHVIQPDTALPRIADPVIIDGTSEPDYTGRPVIELNGANTTGAKGLRVGIEGGGVLQALSVVNFDRAGLDLAGAMTIQGTRIGVDANGNPLGNGGAGISSSADGATIGGTDLGVRNVIAHNDGDGVEMVGVTPPPVQHTVRGNRIFANGGLGIDLEGGTEDVAGRTENDAGDGDDGPNRLQNVPELQSGTFDPSEEALTVIYLVQSDPNVDAAGASNYPLTIDFYVADADDEEGRAYLGTDTYSSAEPDDYGECGDPPCPVTTTLVPQASLTRGDRILATATDEDGNTSEFGSPIRVDFPSAVEADVTLAPEQYRMISVPVRLEDATIRSVFEDDFGPPNRQNWRLLQWKTNPQQSECGAGRYRELTLDPDTEEPELLPGQAYWLISRTGGSFDVDNARSVGGDPVTLTLQPGWTQIASPHPYPVPWSSVAGRSGLQNGSPYAFEPGPEGTPSYVPNTSTLNPWTGYWVCNPGDSPIEITIPPQEAFASTQTKTSPNASSVDVERFFGRNPVYGFQLKASLKRQDGRVQKDLRNVVGVASQATPGLGPEDVIEPPPVQESLRLRIVEDGSPLIGSLRPDGAQGYTWNLSVSAPVPDANTGRDAVHLRLDSYGTLPSNFERRLIDRNNGRRISPERGAYTLPLKKDGSTRHLQLLVGSEDFVGKEADAVRPTRSGLRAVYPNPTRGPVTIDYRLKAAQRVRLSVFDVLGRRVKVLVDEKRPAGHHTIRWSGGPGAGPAVASGFYIVRMSTESSSYSRHVSIVR